MWISFFGARKFLGTELRGGGGVTPAMIAFAVIRCGASSMAMAVHSSAHLAAETAPYAGHAAMEPEESWRNTTAADHLATFDQVLCPVHQRVRHHVERHIHMFAANRRAIVRDVWTERAECQRMKQNLNRSV